MVFVAERFSALQRAEIAEMTQHARRRNQTKRFSALQRAEIAEMSYLQSLYRGVQRFQCSSTSRNC